MRIPMMIANWKMYKTRDEALAYIYAVNMELPCKSLVETAICVQAPILRDMVKRQGENLRIGAQNIHEQKEGAYTGEISAALLDNIGVTYVIIGHSERRTHFHETDETINMKLKTCIRYEMTPILCVGESLSTRENQETLVFIEQQLKNNLNGLDQEDIKNIVIAYEPIWAIGTGINATSEEAREVIAFIRDYISKEYDQEIASQVRILYGGSVNAENIASFMKHNDIDGALVGSASLSPHTFLKLVKSAIKS